MIMFFNKKKTCTEKKVEYLLQNPNFNRNIAIYIIDMGVSKSEEFSDAQNRLAKLAKALGHPARIAILELLIKKNTCICGDLVEELPLSQSTVSQHLKELKEAGLIRGDIEGASICYCIDDKVWKDAQRALNKMFDNYKNGKGCC